MEDMDFPVIGDNFAGLVGLNLKTIMESKKITTKQMAELLHISEQQVKRIKSGTNLLKVEHAWIICKKYGISLDRLYNLRTDINLIPDSPDGGEEEGRMSITVEDSMQNVVMLIDQAPNKAEKKRLYKYAEKVLHKEGLKLMD